MNSFWTRSAGQRLCQRGFAADYWRVRAAVSLGV